MRTSDFDYELPPELIAQSPAEPRDASRLLVLRRADGGMEHRRFRDLPEYLRPGDLLVFNRSRVIPARLRGRLPGGGAPFELLLLRRVSPGVWRALGRPSRRLRPGLRLTIPLPDSGGSVTASGGNPTAPGGIPTPSDDSPTPASGIVTPSDDSLTPSGGVPPAPGNAAADGSLTIEILESLGGGEKLLRLGPEDAIERVGEAPLPPYIRQPPADPQRYQTVYASEPGSAAAPTAGLHFTETLLAQIRAAGVQTAFVTLHIGLDTFRPVRTENPEEHRIHTESYQLDGLAAAALNAARRNGGRIIAVGTTAVRTLEQAAQDAATAGRDGFAPVSGEAGIYILPGHRFRAVDAMITNFHLPRSTLLMLVSAFIQHAHPPTGQPPSDAGETGRELALQAYREAINQGYRFYSFGDAMLLL